MKYSSKLLENAVEALAALPSIGRKSALRLVLHLIDDNSNKTDVIAHSIMELKSKIKKCKKCNNLSDHDICEICSSTSRRQNVICVVESVRDVMAIEDTQQFNGLYHVLGGVICPLEGIGPEDLAIDLLKDRVANDGVEELIMGLSPTIDGETTIYYLSKILKDTDVKISLIARGVAFGGELEYADELTIARSIQSRIPYLAGQF